MKKIWVVIIVLIIGIAYINLGQELYILSKNNKKTAQNVDQNIGIQSSTTTSIATSSIQTSTTTEIIKNTTPSTAKVSTSTPPKPKSKQNKTTKATSTTTISSQVAVTLQLTIPPEPAPDFEKINTDARKAVVNILCSTKTSGLFPISGTGVVVTSNGLILTNAHIGQYFLLKDFREKDYVQCIARTGSPAYPTYNLELVYISPEWITENKTVIKETNPKGTGEHDFAFLRITGRIDGSRQESYSFIPMDIREDISEGENVLLASYPAGFLGGQSIIQGLNIATAIGKVGTLYTFKDGNVDLISVPGTIISQRGSSGGAVVDKRTHLIGLISLSSNANTTAERDLQAITSGYINKDLKTSLGISLAQLIYSNHETVAQSFASTTAPKLTQILTDVLNQ